ncbi:hypothetical protein ACU4GA_26050 [Methylobacterium oryzae CBMB20]
MRPDERYEPNSAVAWTQFSADEALGLVYVPPFGNRAPDQVGVARSKRDEALIDAAGGAGSGDRQAALGVPDHASRPAGPR